MNVENLVFSEQEKIAFFINCYNILNLHSLVEWKRTKGRLTMTALERTDFFNLYKYNIGGCNYSLNDIEHGVLRGNDNFGVSKMHTIRLFLSGMCSIRIISDQKNNFFLHWGWGTKAIH